MLFPIIYETNSQSIDKNLFQVHSFKLSKLKGMNRRKKINSKVFEGFNMDIVIDRDCQHQKGWSDKIQQTKHIKQMKQIDKIFQGIVKQRIFGTIIAQKSRLSNQEYSVLDRINKTVTNSFRNTRAGSLNNTTPNSPAKNFSQHAVQTPVHYLQQRRKINLQPLNLTSYTKKVKIREKALSIDYSKVFEQFKIHNNLRDSQPRQKSPYTSLALNSLKFPSSTEKFLPLFRSKTDVKSIPNKFSKKLNRKQSIFLIKQMDLDKNACFEQHFKSLSLTPNIFLYDIKLTKQTLVSKTKQKVNPRLLEYFLYFFGFPAVMNFRQLKKGIQKAFNSPISLIYFFTFSVLDESGNGFITISDLFRFLQRYPQTVYIEEQIFRLRQKINQVSKQLNYSQNQNRGVKLSLQQVLVLNHKLKADEVSELLKQSVKQEISKGGQVKLTCYSQSVLSLEHDVNVRLKQYELQNQKNQSQAINANKTGNQRLNNSMNQDGIRLKDFRQIFNGRRPKVFCILVSLLTGLSNQDYQ